MVFEAAVLDLHGTVYRGDRLLPGAADGVRALRDAGLDVLFCSNNPTRTPADYAATLREFGVSAAPDRVLTAGVLTREYLRANHATDRVYVVGEAGLVDQLEGVDLTDDPAAAEVLLGSIDRSLSYDRLADALRAVRTGIEAFLGTDPDRVVPAGPTEADLLPGSGAVVGAVAATVGREPDLVLGKPSAVAVDAARDRLGCPPDRWLVVGDRLDTDVALGARAGATTALVETGVHGEEDLPGAEVSPDHVLDSLGAVGRVL